MAEIEIQNLVLGMVSTNCYFVKNKESRELLLIDPADQPDAISRQVAKMNGIPKAVLLTHGHFDHMMAARACADQYKIPVYAHELEEAVLENSKWNLSGLWMDAYVMKADVLLKDKEQFTLAGFQIQVLHTPGHTQGSCCYYLREEQVLFSGDTLFAHSYGRTDFPTSSMTQMRASISRLLDELPDSTEVFPGHEAFSSIAEEKRYNPLA